MRRALAIPPHLFKITKEIARHLLRRPVVGVAVAGKTPSGRWMLVRRGDTGDWALPGGTLEWGETLRVAAARELREETGCQFTSLGRLLGVYSAPERDPRFHAVTVLVTAEVSEPDPGVTNPLEIREVRGFLDHELPERLCFGMTEMLEDARAGTCRWE